MNFSVEPVVHKQNSLPQRTLIHGLWRVIDRIAAHCFFPVPTLKGHGDGWTAAALPPRWVANRSGASGPTPAGAKKKKQNKTGQNTLKHKKGYDFFV